MVPLQGDNSPALRGSIGTPWGLVNIYIDPQDSTGFVEARKIRNKVEQ